MRRLLIMLCLSLFVLPFSTTRAQDQQSPILALHEGAIYAVSPIDGSAQTLVAAPDNYQALREELSTP